VNESGSRCATSGCLGRCGWSLCLRSRDRKWYSGGIQANAGKRLVGVRCPYELNCMGMAIDVTSPFARRLPPCGSADGRKPPAAFRTEGARAGKGVGVALAGAFARRLPPGGSADGRKPPAAFRTEGARAGKGVGVALAGAFARRLPPGGFCRERSGGSPRLCFAPKVRTLAGVFAVRCQGRFTPHPRPLSPGRGEGG
jgi:hypothetical protein